MKHIYFFLVIVSSVVFVNYSCTTGSRRHGANESAYEQGKSDTMVNSIPVNYMNYLKNLDASQKIKVDGYKELFALYEKYNYTQEVWQNGIREVPRLYISDISEEWGKVTTKGITVEYKKRIFFRVITPLILRANELIMKDRNRLTNLINSFKNARSLSEKDRIWIRKLAKIYKIEISEENITRSHLEKLHKRVDIIPASLALSQAAAESGWGTSGFAANGNALYGQWSWGKDAMIPDEQRTHLGNYGVASFESLQESVSAYMLNLNSHNAYSGLRDKRAQLRKSEEKLSGYILAEGLLRYSEKGESYVKTIQSLMEFNKLEQVDDAYLAKGEAIYMY